MVKAESPKAYVLTEKGRHSILTLHNKTNLWNEFTFCKSLKSKFDVSNGGKAEVHDNLSILKTKMLTRMESSIVLGTFSDLSSFNPPSNPQR